jgi:glycosyltransferase involved in cell wall biosynthesis
VSDRPEIAVLVAAYRREEFLLGAVRSVLAQTVPRERYEVVVVKDFRRPEIDRELEREGVRTVEAGGEEIGRFLRAAIDASSAPWLTFLDDDDEFEPGRLERILSVSREHPDVGFYRNRVRVVDRAGRALPVPRWRPHEVDAAFDALGEVHLRPGESDRAFEIGVERTSATFNSSSMAIRREVLDGEIGAAFDRQRMPDSFLLVAPILARVGLFLDPARLTRFRYWGESRTGSARWFGWVAPSVVEIADLAARRGELRLAAWFRDLAVHYGRMERGARLTDRIADRAGRREVARLAREYLSYLGRHPSERKATLDTWAAGLYGLAYPLAPGTVRHLAAARLTARREGAPEPSVAPSTV